MNDNLHIHETFINKTEGHIFSDTDVYEAYTDRPGQLFRDCQQEYGRCTGKCFIDRPDGSAQHIGWVFEKRMQYEDCPETYLREVWVSLHTAPETRTAEYHYADLGGGS